MTSSRRPSSLALAAFLVASVTSVASAAEPRTGATRRASCERAVSAVVAALAGGDVEAMAGALREEAAAQPARASEMAALLLLLDRNDAALEVLLDAGRNAEAFELLASSFRLSEALMLPDDPADADLRLARARALVLAGRPRDAAALLAGMAGGDERTALRAVREASALGLRDDVLGAALDRASGAGLATQRELTAALWPLQRLQAEAAWRWLRVADAGSRADESLARLRDILDASKPSSDADAILAGGLASMGSVSPCEEPRLRAGLILLAEDRDEPEAALRLAREWTASGGAPAWMTLGDMLRHRQDWQGAAEAYGRAADASPGEGAARWLQSAMLAELGDKGGARALADSAQSGATTSCARQRLACAMDSAGDASAALKLREAMLADADGAALTTVAAAVGRRAARAESLKAVRAAFRSARLQALRQSPTVARVLPLVRAAQAAELRSLVRLGELDAALARSEHALDAFVLDVDATADLADALRRAGRGTDADALLARVGERIVGSAADFPESARLLNARAWFGARTRSGLEDARAAAERAASLAPSDAGILDTLAEVRFQQGDRAGALEAGRRARDLEPEREYFALQLGRFASGDPSSAPPVAAAD